MHILPTIRSHNTILPTTTTTVQHRRTNSNINSTTINHDHRLNLTFITTNTTNASRNFNPSNSRQNATTITAKSNRRIYTEHANGNKPRSTSRSNNRNNYISNYSSSITATRDNKKTEPTSTHEGDPYPDMNIIHWREVKNETSTIIVQFKTTKEYVTAQKENKRTFKILKMYYDNLNTYPDKKEKNYGVKTWSSDNTMVVYINNEEWNSANHIHLLTIVRKLIMPDIRKLMGKEWINRNYRRNEADETLR